MFVSKKRAREKSFTFTSEDDELLHSLIKPVLNNLTEVLSLVFK